ncbi:hypothetical protein AVEN_167404-1 [Araneus ventricosus]|uniref:Uncharacterized protein n=1 Tax=Araneus ventricosus TaxID=182803 RepID=A0A4Y2ARB5_ARAVE|nr:hypothetical protein AVEN_167404-1 [Araneus ventricosus]
MKILSLAVIFCLTALAQIAAVSSDSADSESNEVDEYFSPEKFQALIFGTDFRNVSRSGRQLDEVKEDGRADEEGRIIPGATSFLKRLALQVLMFKVIRAFVQYFVDLLIGDLFSF